MESVRRQRGLPASAVACRSGVSLGHIRNIERGLRHPKAAVLARILDALDATDVERAEARRLAGIDPNPSTSKEARAARRGKWQPLTFILANDILLPCLRLDYAFGARLDLAGNAWALVHQALKAADMATFVDQTADVVSPPPDLTTLLESSFGHAPADLVEGLESLLSDERYLNEMNRHSGQPPLAWKHTMLRSLILSPAPPTGKDAVFLRDVVEMLTFDRSFAVCFFPAVYWTACRNWPFEKVWMPLSRASKSLQKAVYERIQAGLSLEDFDRAMIGQGDLGDVVRRAEPARFSPDEMADSPGRPWSWEVGRGSCRVTFSGPRPPNDLAFDHLDRCTFLERFPYLKVDREAAAKLARSVMLPSWQAWVDHIIQHEPAVPADHPLRSKDRFDAVVAEYRDTETREPNYGELPSLIHRLVSLKAGWAMAALEGWASGGLAEPGRRTRIAAMLGFRDAWQDIIRKLEEETPPGGAEKPTAPDTQPAKRRRPGRNATRPGRREQA